MSQLNVKMCQIMLNISQTCSRYYVPGEEDANNFMIFIAYHYLLPISYRDKILENKYRADERLSRPVLNVVP